MKIKPVLLALSSIFLLAGCNTEGSSSSSSASDPEPVEFDLEDGTYLSSTLYSGNRVFTIDNASKKVTIKSYIFFEDYLNNKVDSTLSYDYQYEYDAGVRAYQNSIMTIKEENYEFSFYYLDNNGEKGDFVLKSKYVYASLDARVGKLVKEDEATVKDLKDIATGKYLTNDTVPYYSKKDTLDGDRYIQCWILENHQIQLYQREHRNSGSASAMGSTVKFDFFNADSIGTLETWCYLRDYNPETKSFKIRREVSPSYTMTAHFDEIEMFFQSPLS